LRYFGELKRELENRSQSPTESLTSYIRIIRDYYERIVVPVAELTIVTQILQTMNPEYRQALLDKDIRTLVQSTTLTTTEYFKFEAHKAQELIKHIRTYRPPPTTGNLEPSLAWKPILKSSQANKDETVNMTVESERKPSKLHFASLDPFAYHHSNLTKTVKFQVEAKPPNTPPRSSQTWQKTSPRNENANLRERRTAGGSDNGGDRGCFNCGSLDHFRRNCPKLVKTNSSPKTYSGNGSTPSPAGSRDS